MSETSGSGTEPRKVVGWWIPPATIAAIGGIGRVFIYPVFKENTVKGLALCAALIVVGVGAMGIIMYALNSRTSD